MLVRYRFHDGRTALSCIVSDLSARRFRHAPDVRVFLGQLMFCLQPIVHILSVSTATLNEDLACAQLNFLTRGV
jgi:hypothetical protein